MEEDTETHDSGADENITEEKDDADDEPVENSTTDTVDDADTSTNVEEDGSNASFRLQSAGGCLVCFSSALYVLI